MARVLRSQTSSARKESATSSPTSSKVTKPKSHSAKPRSSSFEAKIRAVLLQSRMEDEASDSGPWTNARAMEHKLRTKPATDFGPDTTLYPQYSQHDEPIYVVLSFKELFDFIGYKTMAWFEYNWGTYNDASGVGLYHHVNTSLIFCGDPFETRELMTGRRVAVGNEAMKEILTWSREERARRKWIEVRSCDLKLPFYKQIQFAVLVPETMDDVVGEVTKWDDIHTPW